MGGVKSAQIVEHVLDLGRQNDSFLEHFELRGAGDGPARFRSHPRQKLTKPSGVKSADPFYQRLMLRAATIDELLSDEFEAGPGGNGEADLAGRRLAAWCKSSASGDWSLFERRLERDGLSRTKVMERLSGLRRRASVLPPEWLADAIWIEAALHGAPTIAESN